MTTAAVESVQVVRRADGLLAAFNHARVLGAGDVHVALRLRRLGWEPDETVLLAAALAVRAVRQGSVVLELADVAARTAVDGLTAAEVAELPWPHPDRWHEVIERSPLVAVGPEGLADRPLRFIDGLLYLDRYWRQERVVADYVDRAMLAPPLAPEPQRLDAALRRLFPPADSGATADQANRQRLAAYVAAHRRFSIVAGGPGTGKTTTVARLLAVLHDVADSPLRVALAAPTAVAAARLTLAAAYRVKRFDEQDRAQVGTLTASTVHRLLGSRRGERTRFWHNRDNRLPYDVVVVDEASMVSLTLMSRLIEALRPDSRLILVGDPDQLSSIEVGAVLGDLVHRAPPAGVVPLEVSGAPASADVLALSTKEQVAALTAGVVVLTEPHRFGGTTIEKLAAAIRAGDADDVLAVLRQDNADVEFVDADPATDDLASLRDDVVRSGRRLIAAARAGHATDALAALSLHRVLCGHREGPYGVAHWSREVEAWLREAVDRYASDGLWYVGRPLLVTSNDYQLRLFNGDTGVIIDDEGQPRAAFLREGRLDLLAPSRLGDVQTLHAMSIHRSQGSQFETVTVVLPPEESPLLTRELLYTAVTRAKARVRVIGTDAAVRAAVRRPIVRASGLRSVRPQTSGR